MTPPNARRVSSVLRERNFGMIEIDWNGAAPLVTVRIHDEKGAVKITQVIDAGTLKFG